jgi:putative FmdB family regulatory protein
VPTYQYACTECDHAFDQVQSFSEDSLTVCPQCEGRLRKIFNAVGVVFKGSGFYRTDNRAEPKTSSGDSSASSKQAETSSGESSSESSATKSDAAPSSGSDSKPADTKPKPKAKADSSSAA